MALDFDAPLGGPCAEAGFKVREGDGLFDPSPHEGALHQVVGQLFSLDHAHDALDEIELARQPRFEAFFQLVLQVGDSRAGRGRVCGLLRRNRASRPLAGRGCRRRKRDTKPIVTRTLAFSSRGQRPQPSPPERRESHSVGREDLAHPTRRALCAHAANSGEGL